jgi:ribosomal protein S16
MLVIRLRRAGSKNRQFYRVVVTEGRSARDGRFVEVLGHYNPRTKPETLVLDQERVGALGEGRRDAVGHGAHADRSDAGAAGR